MGEKGGKGGGGGTSDFIAYLPGRKKGKIWQKGGGRGGSAHLADSKKGEKEVGTGGEGGTTGLFQVAKENLLFERGDKLSKGRGERRDANIFSRVTEEKNDTILWALRRKGDWGRGKKEKAMFAQIRRSVDWTSD